MAKISKRTCIACRKSEQKVFTGSNVLVRLVWHEGKIKVDSSNRMPGRGAYVHRKLECLLKLGSTKLWERAFKLDTGSLQKDKLSVVVESLRNELLYFPSGGSASSGIYSARYMSVEKAQTTAALSITDLESATNVEKSNIGRKKFRGVFKF